jgi:hypothetical protein
MEAQSAYGRDGRTGDAVDHPDGLIVLRTLKFVMANS